MMFGSKKKRAVKAIHENVHAVVSLYQRNYGLPSHFWMDEYVLGFFTSLMGNHAKLATGGRIAGTDFDIVIIEGWGLISGQNGQQLWKKSTELAISNNESYFIGYDRAILIFFLSINKLNPNGMSQEDVKLALEYSGGDYVKASGFLMSDTFSTINERLG